MAPNPQDGLQAGNGPVEPDPEPDSNGVSRRQFIAAAGVAGVAASQIPGTADALSLQQVLGGLFGFVSGLVPTLNFSAWLRRREDFLALRFHFYNLRVANGSLVKVIAGRPSYFAVEFPPQSITERAFFETEGAQPTDPEDIPPPPSEGESPPPAPPGGPENPLPSPIDALLAGPTRLAFEVPNSALPLPYTTSALLSWAKFALRVVPAAAAPNFVPGRAKPRLVAPGDVETQIELPRYLVLSPHVGAAWAHALAPVDHGGMRTELWHTRLARRRTGPAGFFVDEVDTANRTVRGIWARDPGFANQLANNNEPNETEPPQPFRSSLTSLDRYDIVRLSADFTLPDYVPEAIDVDRLMLSSLGGWIDVDGVWDPPTNPQLAYTSDLIQWRHQGVMARDNYVRVVRRGHLFPWGHKAVLIKITERKFARPFGNGQRGAYLRQRLFVVVTQPRKTYDDAPGRRYDSRAFPFRSLKITNVVTPNLEPKVPFGSQDITKVFLLRVGGQPHPFHFVAKDFADQTVEFDAPAVFVSSTRAYSMLHTGPIVSTYNNLADDAVRLTTLKGQKVAVAQPGTLGDTTIQVETMRFGADEGALLPEYGEVESDGDLVSEGQPRFYPTMTDASTRMAAAEQASGGPLTPSVVSYDADYLKNAFGAANASGVFLKVSGATDLQFPTERSGGVLTPNLAITGLSRTLGPVGGDLGPGGALKGGNFDAAEFFGGAEAKILGGIDLFAIIKTVALLGGSPPEAMKLKQLELPDRIETKLDWHPDLDSDPLGIFVPGGAKRLDLEAVLTTRRTTPPTSTFVIRGELRDFTLNLIGDNEASKFLIIEVARLAFTSGTDQKSKVDVDITNTGFAGVLKFVEALSEFCSFGGGSGPTIDVLGDRISASIGIELPNISVGVFSLRNIAVFVGIVIPFDGSPVRVRFAFCERQNQFILTVSIFGGGGFFAVEIGADGVELMEAGLEFGASCAVDLGVASGSVELMAGIYFKVEAIEGGGENCTLTGYVRLAGELDVMGFITLSLEFYMGLSYQTSPEKAVGEATLTVEISVFVFSGSVEITCRRGFGNGPDDPTFGDQIDAAAWDEYTDAFAIGI